MNNKGAWEILRLITPMMIGTLIWIYLNDRTDNRDFQEKMFHKLENIALEFKNIRQEHADYKEKTTAQLVAVTSVCCSENYKRPKILQTSDALEY